MVYFWSGLPLIYTVWSYFGKKETSFVYQGKRGFLIFSTKRLERLPGRFLHSVEDFMVLWYIDLASYNLQEVWQNEIC